MNKLFQVKSNTLRNLCRLGDVATYINGYAFAPSDWDTKGLPIIRIQDLTGNSYQANFFSGQIDDRFKVHSGDILISWSASLGIFEWQRGDAVLNQHIFKVVFDKIDIDKNFFVHQLRMLLDRFASEAHGATMKHLTRPVFNALPFYAPSLDEQKTISSILESVSCMISICQRKLCKLDQMAKSRFIELFGDPEKKPFRWTIAKFDEFASIDAQMTTDYEKYANYPHIGIDSIEKVSGILSGYRTVKEDNVISGKYMFSAKHIIYSKIRPNLNKVALPDFSGLCSADAYPILPKANCSRIYLAFVMRSEFFLKYIVPLSGRSNMPKVNRVQLRGFSMPLPPLALQNEFASFIEELDKSKLAAQKFEVAA